MARDAEQEGYVSRAIADQQQDHEVETMASRLARFDHEVFARTNRVSTGLRCRLTASSAGAGRLLRGVGAA